MDRNSRNSHVSPSGNRKKLGELLIEAELISEAVLQSALILQQTQKKTSGTNSARHGRS